MRLPKLIACCLVLLAPVITAVDDENKHMLSEEELLELVHSQFLNERNRLRPANLAPVRVRRQSGQANGKIE